MTSFNYRLALFAALVCLLIFCAVTGCASKDSKKNVEPSTITTEAQETETTLQTGKDQIGEDIGSDCNATTAGNSNKTAAVASKTRALNSGSKAVVSKVTMQTSKTKTPASKVTTQTSKTTMSTSKVTTSTGKKTTAPSTGTTADEYSKRY